MDEKPETTLVMADLAADTAGNKVVPVLLGSALTGGGVHRLVAESFGSGVAPSSAPSRTAASATDLASGPGVSCSAAIGMIP